MIRYLTAGESHGKAIIGIVEGIPASIHLTEDHINTELQKRKDSVGRGGRGAIESDSAEIISGVRNGLTLGSPITVLIKNKDWVKWASIMDVSGSREEETDKIVTPRPGHADLAGMMKYGFDDARNILERASARETAARVAIGAIAKQILGEFGISITSYVTQIGKILYSKDGDLKLEDIENADPMTRCPDEEVSSQFYEEVEGAQINGDSLGGIFKILVFHVPPGIGSYVHWDRRLDGQLAMALMSIPAIKSVEVGMGKNIAGLRGSEAMDEIFFDNKKGFHRKTNNMGGIEGGMSNGETIILSAAMKPIPTIKKALRTVNTETLKPQTAHYERSDVCAVPRAAVIGESVTAFAIANAMMEKFGGDTKEEMLAAYKRYIKSIKWVR